MSESERDKFTSAVEDAITKDRLVIAGITSNTQATFESEGVPYGAGKSTLAQWLSFKWNHYDAETGRYYDMALDVNDMANWQIVRDRMYYYPSKLLRGLKGAATGDDGKKDPYRINAAIWDDVQWSAGARAGLPVALEELKSDLTVDRPEIALLILTMPNVADIASVMRGLVQFELIVYARGYFEIQKTTYRKNFRNPKKDLITLDFVSGQDPLDRNEPDFYDLPQGQRTWYVDWRATEKSYKRERTIHALERFERTIQAPLPTGEKGGKGWRGQT